MIMSIACVIGHNLAITVLHKLHCMGVSVVQLAAQWLVIGSGEASLYLQREIGLSAFLAAIQTFCLKVCCSHCVCMCACVCACVCVCVCV